MSSHEATTSMPGVRGEELLYPLQDEHAVVRDGDPNRHSGNDKPVRAER